MRKLLISVIASISFGALAEQCENSHVELSKQLFEQVEKYEEIDVNLDGISEYLYSGDCGMRGCVVHIMENIEGCFSSIFRGTSELQILDKVPQRIRDASKSGYNYMSEYKPISSFESFCAGSDDSTTVSLYSKKQRKYVVVYSESVDWCKF